MKKFTSILLAMILTLCVPVMTIAEADTHDLQNTIETFSTDGGISDEYIYYSDLFYGYSTYLTQNTYLTGLESNTTQVTTNILNEYITTNHFKASAVFEGIGIAADATSVAKYISDNIGLSNFKFNSELDKANQKFAEALCDVNLNASKQIGSENKYIKNINKFLGVVEKIDKIALEDEAYYKDLNKPELYDYFADRSFAVLKEYCTQLEPKLPSLKAELYTALNETTEILGNLNDALDFTKALALSITMQETQMELVQDIINTQSTSSTLYKGMTRLKNQLSNGFVSYFADTYIKDKVYDKVIGYLPKLTSDAILGGWNAYGSFVTAVVNLVNSVVFKGWLGYDYSEYTSAVMLVQYASDLYNSIKNKTSVFKSQFNNNEIERFETIYNAYVTMKSAAFKECKNIAEHNSIYGLEYMDDISYIFETENAYQKYVVGVKSFIEMIPYESRTVTNYDVWTLNNNTNIEGGSDCINSNTIYVVGTNPLPSLTTGDNIELKIMTDVRVANLTLGGQIAAIDSSICVYADSVSFKNVGGYGSDTNYYWNKGNLYINNSLSLMGNQVNSKRLFLHLSGGNLFINGDLNINAYSYVYLNDSSALEVSGGITISAGYGSAFSYGTSSLQVNEGEVICEGDMILNKGTSGYGGTLPQGSLYLNTMDSYVEVHGNLVVDGNTDYRKKDNIFLKNGNMYVRKNIEFASIYCCEVTNGNLILCGDSIQSITNVPIYRLQVLNKNGIELKSQIHVFGDLQLNGNPIECHDNIIYLYSNGKLSQDGIYSNIVIKDCSYVLNEPLVVSGDFTIDGHNTTFTNNSSLIVYKDFNLPRYSHFINNGSLSVFGNVSLGYVYGNTYYFSTLKMGVETASIQIKGNISFADKRCNNITGGLLILNGISKQEIENISAPTIVINNNSEDGVVFKSSITPSKLFDHKGNTFSLYNNGKGSTFVDYDGDGLKDNIDPEPTEFVDNENYFSLFYAITDAESYLPNESMYSADSFQNLKTAIRDSRANLVSSITIDGCNQQKQLLLAAIDQLENRYITDLSIQSASSLYWNADQQIDKIYVLVTYDNGTTEMVKGSDCEIAGYNSKIYDPQVISITYNGFEANLLVTVNKVPIASALYETIPTQLFYGSAVTPVPTLTSRYNEGIELIYGEDYTVSYTNNDAVGTGRAIITGIGNYYGTRSLAFTIECGHCYGDWIIDSYATPSSNGEEHRTCSICGHEETRSINALDHSFANYVSNNDATCTADGTKTAKCDFCDATDTITDVGSRLGHSFTNYTSDGNATCTSDGTKTAKCDRCDITNTVIDTGSKLGHTGGSATCIEKAKCSICGAEYGEYGAHHLTHHDRVEPDYENEGNIEYWTCDECGKYFSDTEGNSEISADDVVIAKLVVSEYQFIDGEVIIEAPAGAIPEGSLFDVQKIVPPPSEIVEKVKDQMGSSSEVLAYYEIRLSDTDGELIIHLDGEITIKTKMPERYVGSKCVRILQEDENGKLIVMESWWENDYLCYKTDWLEFYN